jgi:FAD/FMN-containing dehydrogenase
LGRLRTWLDLGWCDQVVREDVVMNVEMMTLGGMKRALPEEDPVHIGWPRDCWEAVRQWSSGAVYMNALSDDEGAKGVREAYGANYPRLAALKAALDPKNVFRLNQNIAPAT